MLTQEEQTLVRAWLARIAGEMEHKAAETRDLAQLRCNILRMVRDRGRLTYDALGALAGVSAARAGELCRAGDPTFLAHTFAAAEADQ